jgi:hypothetical protein
MTMEEKTKEVNTVRKNAKTITDILVVDTNVPTLLLNLEPYPKRYSPIISLDIITDNDYKNGWSNA